MSLYKFNKLKLKRGDVIYLQNEKGEGHTGSFEDDYNDRGETFKFSNFSNGRTETVVIEKLQELRKI